MPPRSRTIPTAVLLCGLLHLLFAAAPVLSAPALRPDPTFGKHGVAEPRLGPRYAYTSFRSIAVEPDGSLLAARHGADSYEHGVTYRRYTPRGAVDPSFKPDNEMRKVEAVDAEGKRLVASIDAVERFNLDGSRDPSFGADPSNGKPWSDVLPFTIEVLLPTPSGKIVAAGTDRSREEDEEDEGEEGLGQVVVARLDHQGHLDSSFGGDGVVRFRDQLGVVARRMLGVLAHGEESAIVVTSEAREPGYEGQAEKVGGSAVVAFGADGRPDPAYGEGGVVRSDSSIEAFAALPDGGLLLAGNRWGKANPREEAIPSDLYVSRLTAAGRYDPAFSGDGVATVDFGDLDRAAAVLAEPDGSVVVGGSTMEAVRSCLDYDEFCRETPVIARLRADGAPDSGFGNGGRLRLDDLSEGFAPLGAGRGVRALTALPDGDLLAGGGSGIVAFMTELSAAGTPVSGFGKGGTVIERDPEAAEVQPHAVAVDRRRRILVATESDAGTLFGFERGAVYRFRPDGTLDRSYGDGSGLVRMPGNTRDISVGPKGDAFVLSGEFAANVVIQVTPEGALDRKFGSEGMAPLPRLGYIRKHGKRHYREFDPRSVAALPGGGVLVGGEGGGGNETRIVLVRYDRHGRLDRRFGKGGVAILAMGRTRECNMTQLAVGRGGRILIAGRVRHRGEEGRRPALFQVRPDGSPDRFFSRGGVAEVPLPTEGSASSLSIRPDGSVLVAGRQEIHNRKRTRPLLVRFSRDGALDRGFVRRMRAGTPTFGDDEGLAARQILPTARGIFTVAPYRPILAFSHRGSFRGSMEFDRRTKPARWLVDGALQGDRPVLIGGIGRDRGLVLRRFVPR